MEFFAKSKENILSEEKLNEIKKYFDEIMPYLSENEQKSLQNALDKIKKKVSVPQKTLSDHLKETEKVAEEFFKTDYGTHFSDIEKAVITLSCKLHDIGKADIVFQAKIGNDDISDETLKKIKEIPHGYLSALSINKKYFCNTIKNKINSDSDREIKPYHPPFITAIYHHHVRENERKEADDFENYASKYYDAELKEFLNDENIYLNKLLFSRVRYTPNSNVKFDEKEWLRYVLVKGMLNKFDYNASAGFTNAEEYVDIQNKQLCNNINSRLKTLRKPQTFMQVNTDKNVILVAGTGSGKTEASLLWLNGEKGFYTLPIKVSATAIYKRIKNYDFSHVTLLHSDSLTTFMQEDEEYMDRYEKSAIFAYPLTVCTVDQIFKFVYKSLGTEIFAATLKYSKVIIDEIQSYSPDLTAKLLYGLKIIDALGGKYAIITATFPPVIKHFMEYLGLWEEDNKPEFADYGSTSDLKRHFVSAVESDIDYEKIIKSAEIKKVLVICNTITKSQEVYEELIKKCDNTYIKLLHSLFTKRDRALLEEEIMRFSNSTEHGIWVSTQIVEASLDIDFDELHTEFATADSLLQRFGRCNRKGRYTPDRPNVYIYDGKANFIYDEDILTLSKEYLHNYTNQIFSEKMKIEYINEVYDIDKIKETKYFKEIKNTIESLKNFKPLDFTKEEINKYFRPIKNTTVIPDTEYDADFVDSALNFLNTPNVGKEARNLVRNKLFDRTVSINSYKVKQLMSKKNVSSESLKSDVTKYSKYKRQYDSNIHRCHIKYEFNKKILTGRGLILNEIEEADQVL